MSPEQGKGFPTDARSDLYAVGAILYRCLTGEEYLSFTGKGQASVLEMIQRSRPRLPHAAIRTPVAMILTKALAKDPAKRFQSARAMADALRPLLLEARGGHDPVLIVQST